MNRRWMIGCFACGILLVAFQHNSYGQNPYQRYSRNSAQPGRPVTSPYLNLLTNDGNGNNFAFNYYRRVKPEMDLRRADGQLNGTLQQLRPEVDPSLRTGSHFRRDLRATGHRAGFLTFGNYFPGRTTQR